MRKKDFLLRKEYGQWLVTYGGIKTKGAQNCYIMQDIFPNTNLLYYDIIASFFFYDERVYAYTVLEEWYRQIEKAPNAGNKKSYWNKYKTFIHAIANDAKKSIDPAAVIPYNDLKPVRKRFKKSELAKLDGMEALVSAVEEEHFIKLVVESSFFFDSNTAWTRFKDICHVITTGAPNPQSPQIGMTLPARKSNNQNTQTANCTGTHQTINGRLYFVDNKGTLICAIKEDGNGNAMVCQLINNLFGYNMNVNLKDKPFKHYIISHIWGNATDPRYFTSLWNIALVPAWANHLLDKPNPIPGSLEEKLQNTFFNICIKHNELNDQSKYNWSAIRLSAPKTFSSPLNKTYNIQVIKERGNAVIGKIETVKIKI